MVSAEFDFSNILEPVGDTAANKGEAPWPETPPSGVGRRLFP